MKKMNRPPRHQSRAFPAFAHKLSRWLCAGLLTGSAAAAAESSDARSPRFETVPGVVIDHIPASTRVYIGSPSLVIWTNGDYLASHDYFGPGSTRDWMSVFRSADRGRTWTRLCSITNQYWSTLFVHRDALYLIGTTTERYGHLVIRRSVDGGQTWTVPRDARTGLLAADGGYHCAPQPVVLHAGRLWRAMEDNRAGGGWGPHFRAFMMSAPVEADLLDLASWTFSNRLPGDTTNWLGGQFNGWLEGNAVVTPDGQVVNILRVDTRAGPEKAAIVRVSSDGRTAAFDPASGFIDFPGGAKKFTIRFDPASRLYWTLATMVHERHQGAGKAGGIRNTLALTCSPDLQHWTVRTRLLYHPDVARHGFQYVDWLFEGEDLIAACRTAYDDGLGGAHNNHDANFLTFHRIADFRRLTMADSVPLPPRPDTRRETTNAASSASASNSARVDWKQSLRQPAAWYASAEAARVAENLLLYQRDSGGWPKNLDMARELDAAARAQLLRQKAATDSTIDNGATVSQMRFLARVVSAHPQARFKDAFTRGLRYLLAAQYPHGGWPQFWPQPRGYSAHITFNDDAMINVLNLLREVAATRSPVDFVETALRRQANDAVARGVECILKCQIVVEGRRAAWCAQHDEQTLAPASARAYEKPSLSGSESVSIVRFLMSLERPHPRVIEAIESAVAWFESAKLTGIREVRKTDASLPKGVDKIIVLDPSAPPLWARFYELGSNRPIFCGRDGVVRYTLAEIEHERRTGYSWYTDAPARLLREDYPKWKAAHASANPARP